MESWTLSEYSMTARPRGFEQPPLIIYPDDEPKPATALVPVRRPEATIINSRAMNTALYLPAEPYYA